MGSSNPRSFQRGISQIDPQTFNGFNTLTTASGPNIIPSMWTSTANTGSVNFTASNLV